MKTSIILIIFSLIIAPIFGMFQDGEKLTFDIKYGVITAGEATLSINSGEYEGTPVWKIQSNAKTNSTFDVVYKVRDTIDSYWDKQTKLPLIFQKRLSEGKYRQFRTHYFDQEKHTSKYERYNYKTKKTKSSNIKIPVGTQDIFSAFYLTRLQDLKPGKRIGINITSDGKSYNMIVVCHRLETINSIFGKKECIVIQPILKGDAIFKQTGDVFIWLTNDEYKIPLKLESKIVFGSFKAILSAAKNVPY